MASRTAGLGSIAVALLLSAAAGCGSSGGSEHSAAGSPTGAASAAADKVKTDKGVDAHEIRVAVLNDFSGPIASIGTPSAIATESYFKALNEQGGVCGRNVKVVRADTKYDTQIAIQAYRGVRTDVVGIAQLLGTQTVLALANDIKRDGILTLAGTLSSSVIPLDNIYIIATPFSIEAINGVAWAAKERAGADNRLQLGLIYQNDAYGEEGLRGVQRAVDQLPNVELVAKASYSTGDQDFTSQVQQMQAAGAKVVYLADTPRQTAGILGAAAQKGYQPLFVGGSATFASALVQPLGKLLDNFRMVLATAYYGEDVPGMKDMVAAIQKYAPDQKPDNVMVTGWISGQVMKAALDRACQAGDLTRAGLVAAMNGLQVDLKGMGPSLSYGSSVNDRIPSRESRINKINLRTTFPNPVTPYLVSDPAKSFTLR